MQPDQEYDKEQYQLIADRMNALERLLAEAVAEKDKAEQKYDMLFEQVFHEFDKKDGKGVSSSFVCDDGYKLARLVPQMSPQVDAAKVMDVILHFGSGDTGKRMWTRVTDAVRVVNQDKLAAEIRKFPELGVAIDKAEAITVPTRKPSRRRDKATKQELMLLAARQEQAQKESVS